MTKRIRGQMPNLVLGRSKGETIVIDSGSDMMAVTVADICKDNQGNSFVKLGVRAESHVKVDRLEIYRLHNRRKLVDV